MILENVGTVAMAILVIYTIGSIFRAKNKKSAAMWVIGLLAFYTAIMLMFYFRVH